jgi:elongation factor Ts
MPEISATMVKQLRESTGAGVMDCKEALTQCNGDFNKSVEYLRKKGLATAQKRSGRAASAGLIHSYIHMGGKIGVLVEVNCETDFVARNSDFHEFAKNIAMHIAASNPVSISPDQVPKEIVEKEKEIYRAQAAELGKPPAVAEKIAEGKLNKFFKDSCLLTQPYVRDPNLSITDVLNELIGKIGEKIEIKRFVRYQLGE